MKRITILTGHYGSGKSEIAANLALQEKLDYVVDLDVVNPYFRTRSLRDLFEKNNVNLIESTIENSAGSDLPFIDAKGSRPFVNREISAVYDLGGTKHGAKLMIQFRDFIQTLDDIDFLMVVNIYRPETDSAEKIIDIVKTLENASQLKVTGFINNSNLMDYTDETIISEGESIILDAAEKLGVPLKHTFIEENVKTTKVFAGENRPLVRYLAKKWL